MMPDQPRKLPVILVATKVDGTLATDQDGFGLFHEHDNMGQFNFGSIAYIPRPTTCAECRYVTSHGLCDLGHKNDGRRGFFCADGEAKE